MDVKMLDAAAAYANSTARAQAGDAAAAGAAGAASGGSAFGSLVESLVGNVEQASRDAEMTSAKAIAGEAGLVDVVTAVNNAEMVLETVSTVRDRVVRAYEEIMRMPI